MKSVTSCLVSQVPLQLLASPCRREQELLSLPKAGKPANRERRVPAHRSAITGQSNRRDREGAPSSQRLCRDAPTSSKRHLAGPWRLHPGGSGRPWEQDAEGPCAGSPHAQAQGADRQQIRRRRSLLLPSLSPPRFPSLPPSRRRRGAVRVLRAWTQRRTRPPARPGALLPRLRGPGREEPSRPRGQGPGGTSWTGHRWEPTRQDRAPEGAPLRTPCSGCCSGHCLSASV